MLIFSVICVFIRKICSTIVITNLRFKYLFIYHLCFVVVMLYVFYRSCLFTTEQKKKRWKVKNLLNTLSSHFTIRPHYIYFFPSSSSSFIIIYVCEFACFKNVMSEQGVYISTESLMTIKRLCAFFSNTEICIYLLFSIYYIHRIGTYLSAYRKLHVSSMNQNITHLTNTHHFLFVYQSQVYINTLIYLNLTWLEYVCCNKNELPSI